MTRELREALRKTLDAGRRVLTPPGTQTAAPAEEAGAAAPTPPTERPQGPPPAPPGREKTGG